MLTSKWTFNLDICNGFWSKVKLSNDNFYCTEPYIGFYATIHAFDPGMTFLFIFLWLSYTLHLWEILRLILLAAQNFYIRSWEKSLEVTWNNDEVMLMVTGSWWPPYWCHTCNFFCLPMLWWFLEWIKMTWRIVWPLVHWNLQNKEPSCEYWKDKGYDT